MSLSDVIMKIKPTIYAVSGDVYETCICIGDEKPAKELVDAEIKRLQDIDKAEKYKKLREKEYPPLSEFADAFVKLQSGDSSQMDKYVADCLAVKAKYPK